MNMTTTKKVNIAGKRLQQIVGEAKRRLFEFETLASAHEIMSGRAKSFARAKDLIASLG